MPALGDQRPELAVAYRWDRISQTRHAEPATGGSTWPAGRLIDRPSRLRPPNANRPVRAQWCPQQRNTSISIDGIEAFCLLNGVGLTMQNANTITAAGCPLSTRLAGSWVV
jgi:hypothetical protein